MIELARPTTLLTESWWQFVREFGPDELIHGSGYRAQDRHLLQDAEAFELWVDGLGLSEQPGTPMPEGRVPASYRWIVDDGRVVGTISLRHRLDDMLVQSGGHVGYAVAPSARRRGVATAALGLVLEMAAARGLDPLLITCDAGNLASARTIERCGGRFEGERAGLRRYWVRTGAPVPRISASPVHGRRVRLVSFTAEDVAAMLAGRHRDGWAPGYPREDDVDAARMAGPLDEWSPRHVVRLSDGLVVGSIGCFGPPEAEVVEVGYGLVPSARGDGLMTEVLGVFSGALEAAGLQVTARTLPDNVASQRVLARLGFDRVVIPPDDRAGDDGQWLWSRPPGGSASRSGAVGPP